ncbi:MAG: hypothetical protein K2Q12_05710 [Rickettsiales bacterium]|nr:hypothetical protein [Rickettsiales bacterium]
MGTIPMIYDTRRGRLVNINESLASPKLLLPFLRRMRDEVLQLRQQYLGPYENSALQKDIEEYLFFSLVYAKLARRRLLTFPLRVMKSESPDFIIEEGAHRYGLEATKATPEAYQRWVKQAPQDDESYPLHRLKTSARLSNGPAVEREGARLIQAAIVRKSALLRLYRANTGSDHHHLIVKLQYAAIADTENLLKVLWREGMIEGVAGFERIIISPSSTEFILLDPETGGMRRL